MILLKFLYNLLLGIDQIINTILLGHPDETISSRLGRSIGKERYFFVSPFRKLVDLIFFFDKGSRGLGHCEGAVMPLEQQNFREIIDYELWSWSKEN